MIFKFGRGKKLSQVLKVAEFLEKEEIEYELVNDLELKVGPAAEVDTPPAAPSPDDVRKRLEDAGITPTRPIDPAAALWRVAQHDNIVCSDRTCIDPTHLGAQPL